MIVIYFGFVLILVGTLLFLHSFYLFIQELTRKKTDFELFCSDFDAKYSDIMPKNRNKIRL